MFHTNTKEQENNDKIFRGEQQLSKKKDNGEI
jgi:hypothetical protein